MKLIPITGDHQRSAAIELLIEGFGGDSAKWQDAFKAPSSAKFGHGYLFEQDGNFQGVLLLFEHQRKIHGSITTYVNISSWYVREAFRPLAPILMNKATADKMAVYTVFTANKLARPVLTALKFKLVAQGINILLPHHLFHRRPFLQVSLSLSDAQKEAACPWLPATFKDHENKNFFLGCCVSNTETIYFAFHRQYRKGLLTPLLVYSSAPHLMQQTLPSIYRSLLFKHGAAGLLIPRLSEYEHIGGIKRPDLMPIYAKGNIDNKDLSPFYSELLYLQKILAG